MSSNVKFSTALKNAQQNAITAQCGANAKIKIYSGSQPATPDTAVGAQVLLATLTCNATFAPAAVNGVLTLNSITSGIGTAGAGAGTVATWFRLTSSADVAHIDGTVGISGCDLNLDNPNIATGQSVSATAATFTNGN